MAATAAASPYQVHILPNETGLLHVKQSDEVARKASELLQRDLKDHHCFFNADGFHNHLVHQILSLYGTGAGADILQTAYEKNASYQLDPKPSHGSAADDMLRDWPSAIQKYRPSPGDSSGEHYSDFFAFFRGEIEKKGWQDVMSEYVFKGDEAADDLFARLFAGYLHPIIQLMFGMEWQQPAIVAAALAQACSHGDWVKAYVVPADKKAAELPDSYRMPSIVSLFEAVAANKKIVDAVKLEQGNKIRDGVMATAAPEMLHIASSVRVRPDELEERTAEMFNAVVFVAAAAAVRPGKHLKFDFFLMHHVNAAPIFITINAQPWIPVHIKTRLLEYKIRMDLVEYAARGCPPHLFDRITSYKPRKPGGSPLEVISRLHTFDDDGHAMKLGRASLICRDVSRKYEEGEGRLPLRGDAVWTNVYHMIVDSVDGGGPTWVRSAGFADAWKDVEDEPESRL